MTSGTRYLLAAVSGLLMWRAFPPHGPGWLAIPALTMLLAATAHTSGLLALRLGALHGTLFFLPLLAWMRVIGVDAWIVLTATTVAWSALLGVLLARASARRAWIAWSVAALVAIESARSQWPLGGFAWGRMGFVDGPVGIGWAWWLGTGGVAAVAMICAALLLHVVRSVRRQHWVPAAIALALASGVVGVGQLAAPMRAGFLAEADTAVVAVVQGNVPRLGLDFNAQRRAVLDNHVRATIDLASRVDAGEVAQPDIVVWPENASDIDPFRDPLAGRLIQNAVNAIDAPILVGAVLVNDDNTLSNSGIVWDAAGPGVSYTKRQLVPFGEYVPLRAYLERRIERLDRVRRDFVPGEGSGELTMNGIVVGTVICFEVSYDRLVRSVSNSSDVLVVQTNNATYGRTGQPEQQLAMSRLRAVEHGRVSLVAATSGISAVVRPDGSIRDGEELPEFTQGTIVTTVPLAGDRQSPAHRLGWLPDALAWALSVHLLVVNRRRASIAA